MGLTHSRSSQMEFSRPFSAVAITFESEIKSLYRLLNDLNYCTFISAPGFIVADKLLDNYHWKIQPAVFALFFKAYAVVYFAGCESSGV